VVQDRTDLVLVYEAEEKSSPRKLVFESTTGVVFATRFPAEWRQLTDRELLALRQ